MTDQALISYARESIIGYGIVQKPHFVPAPHHYMIAKAFKDVIEKKIKRAMFFAPPQVGKTEIVSRLGPAWAMGKNPAMNIIAASHTASLAEKIGYEVRDLMLMPQHVALFGQEAAIRHNAAASGDFRTNAGGNYFAVGVGGTPIGRSADLIVIDDPIKDDKDIDTLKKQEELIDWYRTKILSRTTNDTAIIVMHQRWHVNDLAGWLMREQKSEDWKVFSFPALAEDNDVLGRKPGEALWPVKHDEKHYAAQRLNVGSRLWASMYQQRPTELKGGEFKEDWLKYYGPKVRAEHWRGMNRYMLIDPAGSKNDRADYTAIVIIGLGVDKNYYLLDAVRDRMNLNEKVGAVMSLHRRWEPKGVGYEHYSMQGDIQALKNAQDHQGYYFTVTELGGSLKNTGSKETRIRRLLPSLEAGQWYFPPTLHRTLLGGNTVDIISEFREEELKAFPAGRHDDMLDALSRIFDLNTVWPMSQGQKVNVKTRKFK